MAHGAQPISSKWQQYLTASDYASPVLVANASSLTLQDLRRFKVKPTVLAPTNAGVIPATLTTSDGWSVTTNFVAGTLAALSPTSNVTQHGTWGSKVMLPPALGTFTGADVTQILSTCQLDSNLFAVLMKDSSNDHRIQCCDAGGTVGTAIDLGTYATGGVDRIYKVSTTSFIIFSNNGGAVQVWLFSVSAASLNMTQLDTESVVPIDVVQLSSTLYLMQLGAANGLQALYITGGNTTNLGVAVASGSIADNTGLAVLRIAKSDATHGVAAYISVGGGTATTRALSTRVVTVDAGTGGITLEAASAGTNILRESIRSFRSCTEGLSYIAVAQNTTATSGSFYGVSVTTVTTATTGTVTTRASDLPAQGGAVGGGQFPRGFIYRQTGLEVIRHDGTRQLFGHLAAGAYCVSISGTALTFGSTFALTGTKTFLRDFDDTITYLVATATVDKLSIASETITSSWQVAAVPTVVVSDYLMDKAVNYNGTWYAWAITTLGLLTPQSWLFTSGNNVTINGPVA